jgi:DNA-binding PadR family transcriptional regulator
MDYLRETLTGRANLKNSKLDPLEYHRIEKKHKALQRAADRLEHKGSLATTRDRRGRIKTLHLTPQGYETAQKWTLDTPERSIHIITEHSPPEIQLYDEEAQHTETITTEPQTQTQVPHPA